MLKMLAFCMLVILAEPAFAKPALAPMDIVRSNVSKTGYVGEKIYMRCFDQTDKVLEPTEAVLWMYLFQDDRNVNSTYVTVAKCDHGLWEYLSYGHQLVGNDNTCGSGLAYIRATEPGNFTYKCQQMYEGKTDLMREVTFTINIPALDNSSISPCLAKYVPSSQNLILDLICTNYHQRDFLNEKEWDNEFFIQHSGDRIIPDITLANKIVARIGLENINSISQYYCINQNHSSPCVLDTITLYNPVGILPIVNRVIEGGDAIFECIFKDGYERGEKYEWRFSRHIESYRISSTASSTLKISDVRFEDDGVIVRCIVNIGETIFQSESLLTIHLKSSTSTLPTPTEAQDVATKVESSCSTTVSLLPSVNTKFNNEHLYISIIVPTAFFICTLCILALVAATSKTRRPCRRLINKDSNVQGAIGLTRLESNARSSRSPTAPSPTPRIPSAAALPLPLTPSLEESSELCPGAMFGGPESSPQQIDHSEAMPSPTSPCQSHPLSALLTSAPNCYHVYYGLEEEKHPLSTSSFGATSMPKCPIKSKSSSTKTHKSRKSSTTQTLPPYEINRSVSLPSKKTSHHSCTGSPHISLTRKGSANDQSLPPIPKSPGPYDEQETITESRLSIELPVAVSKPMIYGYSSIQDDRQVHGDERLSTQDASGLHGPSATTTNNDVHEGYTGYTYGNENLQNILVDGETESSSRSSSLIPECHTYAVAGNDADEYIAAQSTYHTIGEEKSGTLLSVGGQPVRRADDATSAKRDSVSSNRHIYEMPVDNIAPEVNNQPDSAKTTFYFTLESEKDRNSRDVTVEQSPT